MSSKEKFAIHRLNELEFGDGENRNFGTIENKINEITHGYNPIRTSVSEMSGVKIKLFHKQKESYGIWEFIQDIVPEGQKQNIRKTFKSFSNHDILFFYTENYVYGVSAGSGYKVFENYIDDEFSSNILKRSLEPNFKLAETRSISGQTHAEQQIFKGLYRFDRSESFGKIYKKLAGKIRSDCALKRYFHTEKDISAIMQSNAIKVGTSVTIQELISLIKELESIKETPLTPEEIESFQFLNSISPITIKEKKESLMKEFFKRKILPYLQTGTGNLDVEFCSPDNISTFFCGNRYTLSNGQDTDEFESYDIKNVLNLIKDKYDFNRLTIDDAFNLWKKYSIEVGLESLGTDIIIKYKLYKCVHGEFFFDADGKYYFIIDGNVYKLSEEFRIILESDIKTFLNDNTNMINTIPFKIPKNILSLDEGKFNELQLGEEDFICCDRVFIGGKGGVELFDLIYETNDTIFIIHVKHGFDANMRDVCSQIEIGAKHIEEDLTANRGTPVCIKNLYNIICGYGGEDPYRLSLKTKIEALGFDSFRDKFYKKRVYVVGLITPNIITSGNINQYNSNIARNEIIGTKILFKQKYGNGSLKVAFITP